MDSEELETALQKIIENQSGLQTAELQSVIQTSLAAYQTARTDGLCHEGAWEIALQTLPNYLFT